MKYLKGFLVVLIFTFTIPALASAANITSSSYAWSESSGWISFGSATGNVTVSDTALSGYAYGDNIGWISLNCSNTNSCGTVDYKVTNDGQGILGGHAWSESVGWIDFSGVEITEGEFDGFAYNDNIGFISFNCSNTDSCGTVDYKVSTTWAPAIPESTSQRKSGSSRRVVSSPSSSPSSTVPSTTPSSTPDSRELASQITAPTQRDLTLSSQGQDVLNLQKFLNSQGFTIATTGPGSSGNETQFFGPLTRAALARFQQAKGITPAVGYFGPITRGIIKNI